jgi:hypothetical protein
VVCFRNECSQAGYQQPPAQRWECFVAMSGEGAYLQAAVRRRCGEAVVASSPSSVAREYSKLITLARWPDSHHLLI